MSTKGFLLAILALLSGAALTIAFSPFNIYSVAFFSPAILLYIFLLSKPKQATGFGWLFGFGFFATGSSWVYVSIHQFGNASAPLAGVITALFCAFLGLFFALFGYVFRRCFAHISETKQSLLIFPALWVIFEYLRSILFSGFPWLLAGYADLTTPLKGFAPIFGIYGLSLITVIIGGALVVILKTRHTISKLVSLGIIFGMVFIGWLYENHSWTKSAGNLIKVSLIQGNIPQTVKWDPSYLMQNIDVYKHLTFDNWSSKLIVWPEGAMPIYAQDATQFINQLGSLAKKNHSNILFGVPIRNDQTGQYYNGLMLIGENEGQYLKRHLVPFGEYTPLTSLFGRAMQYFNIPMSSFTSGPQHQPDLVVNHIRIAPFICYEIAFPEQVLNASIHSELLLTVSDDSWFGHSLALAQQLQMSQMRSLETGRYQLLDTNTGITAFISPFGDVIQGAPIDQRVVITGRVQPMTGKTPLMKWRYYPVIAMVLLLLAFGML